MRLLVLPLFLFLLLSSTTYSQSVIEKKLASYNMGTKQLHRQIVKHDDNIDTLYTFTMRDPGYQQIIVYRSFAFFDLDLFMKELESALSSDIQKKEKKYLEIGGVECLLKNQMGKPVVYFKDDLGKYNTVWLAESDYKKLKKKISKNL